MAYLPTTLTLADAETAVRAGCEAIAGGVDEVDLSRLQRFDSAALAAVLEWRRVAEARQRPLRVTGIPSGLASIARVYGVDHLLES